jgi:hypothetical protein
MEAIMLQVCSELSNISKVTDNFTNVGVPTRHTQAAQAAIQRELEFQHSAYGRRIMKIMNNRNS